MIKICCILFSSIFLCIDISAQNLSAIETVKHYSIAQKRLLAVSTAQFANSLTQHNLDQDSLMLIACRVTGMPILLPYNEGFEDKVSGGEGVINAGNIEEANQLLKTLSGEKRIQLLIELGIWYLHQPGTHKKDLDSSAFYINAALTLSTTGNYQNWQTECKFLFGELFYQQGKLQQSKNIYQELVTAGEQNGDVKTVARAYCQLALLLPIGDSIKFTLYQKSLQLYQKLEIKEKEIELLGNILECHIIDNMKLSEIVLHQILSLMQSANFKHVLYTENLLSYTLLNQAKYVEALAYANSAFKNMKWSGIDAVAGAFLIRIGINYEALGKNEEALSLFKMAINGGTNETHLFWYKSLFFVDYLLQSLEDKPAESLALLNSTIAKFPPVTSYEKFQVMADIGFAHQKLNEPKQADKAFTSLLKLTEINKTIDPLGELSIAYYQIGDFYVTQQNLRKARLFLRQATASDAEDYQNKYLKYFLLYRIDSAEKNFKSALPNYINYKLYYDSAAGIEQRKELHEMTVKYAAEKKDQDIKLLKQHAKLQEVEITRNKFTHNIMVGGSVILLGFLGLLYSRFRLKQKTYTELQGQQKEIAQKNIALQNLVEEKEWLLKEVHHRVKNNLQTVVSLLELQSRNLRDEALSAIQDSQNRIYTMSLIHQKLYQTDNIASINMQPYLVEFIAYLRTIYNPEHKIKFDLQVGDVELDVSQAIPLGLIVNEAVTNSIKYAFNYTASYPEISIILKQNKKGNLKLIVADNGLGLPGGFDVTAANGLGFKLMKALVEDIEGKLTIESEQGTFVQVEFNASVPFFEKAENSPSEKVLAL